MAGRSWGLRLSAPPPSELVQGWLAGVAVAFLIAVRRYLTWCGWCGVKEDGFTVALVGEGAVPHGVEGVAG